MKFGQGPCGPRPGDFSSLSPGPILGHSCSPGLKGSGSLDTSGQGLLDSPPRPLFGASSRSLTGSWKGSHGPPLNSPFTTASPIGKPPLPVQFDYLNVLVFAVVGFAFVFVNVLIGSVLRPKRKTDVGLEVYECGEETIGDSWINFDIRYYTVALIYVIFAVEITFLFPWAMVFTEALSTPDIGLWALAKGALFIVILFFGLIAVWAKGDLDWVLSYDGPEYVPTAERHREAVPSLDELSPPEGDEDASHETEIAADAASA